MSAEARSTIIPVKYFVNVTKVLLLSRRVRKWGREDSRHTEGIRKHGAERR